MNDYFDREAHRELQKIAIDSFTDYDRHFYDIYKLCDNHAHKIYEIGSKKISVRQEQKMNSTPHFFRHEDFYLAYRIVTDRKKYNIVFAFFKEFKTSRGRVYGFWFDGACFFYTAHAFDRLVQRHKDEAESRYQAIKIILEEWLLLMSYRPDMFRHFKPTVNKEEMYATFVIPTRIGLSLGVSTTVQVTYASALGGERKEMRIDVGLMKTFVSEDMLRHDQQYKHYLPYLKDIEESKKIKFGKEVYLQAVEDFFKKEQEQSSTANPPSQTSIE